MLSSLSGPPVYRLRPAERVDSVGDVVRSWAEPDRARIPRAQVQEVSSREADGTVVRLDGERRLLVDGPRPDLDATDRVEYLGEVWRVDGEPITKPGLAMGSHTVAKLIRHETR